MDDAVRASSGNEDRSRRWVGGLRLSGAVSFPRGGQPYRVKAWSALV